MDHLIKKVDGKIVKRFIWAYYSHILSRPVTYQVEAFDLDHSRERLWHEIPGGENLSWEFIHECEPDEFMGARMAYSLPLKLPGMQ